MRRFLVLERCCLPITSRIWCETFMSKLEVGHEIVGLEVPFLGEALNVNRLR